jgi:hypothetical protein
VKVSFLSLLAIVFITLKLCAVIDWSWWLVLLPLYGPLALVFLFVATLFVIGFVGGMLGLIKS